MRAGGLAAIVPTLALADLEPGSFVQVPAKELEQLERDLVLAWNPRLVSVRPGAAKLIGQLQQAWRVVD